jgi:hypothetical protein
MELYGNAEIVACCELHTNGKDAKIIKNSREES